MNKRLAFGLAFALVGAAAGPAAAQSLRPNILILFDTSGSMQLDATETWAGERINESAGSCPAVPAGKVSRLFSLKASAKKVPWYESLDGTIEGAAKVGPDRIYVGTSASLLYGLDPAAAKQRAVGRVDDGANVKRGDVGDDNVEPRLADLGAQQRLAHAHSALTSACRSTVPRTPISAKCSSRKRRAARLPWVRSISKKS